jgi:hypothetical protein
MFFCSFFLVWLLPVPVSEGIPVLMLVSADFFLNLLYCQKAYLSTDWWPTAAAAPLDLPRRLETCAGERLVEHDIRLSPDPQSC